MAQNIHEVVIIQRPTSEQREAGAKDELLLGPVQVMAESDRTAIAVAVLTNKDKLVDKDLCNTDIQVRKFV